MNYLKMNEQFVKVQVLSYIMIKDGVLAFHHLIAVKGVG